MVLSRFERELKTTLSSLRDSVRFHRDEIAASVFEERKVERLRHFVADTFKGAELKERQGMFVLVVV